MLKPRYIEELPEAMIALYSQVEMDILADMARRINTYDYYIPSAQWQQRKLVAMGNYHSFVTKALASRTAMTEKEIERLMEEAGAKAIAFDDAIYQRMGLHPPPLAASPALLATLEAGKRNTKGLFQNLCQTTANQSGKQFTNALDRAYLQILSGAFDRNTAVKMAIKNLAKEGVEAVEYPSGRRDTLEVAVRRAVVTGVNQTCLKLQEMRADEMGCDLVETTAHGGARPDHAKWQGKVFSRSGTSRKYEDFAEATGYGTGAGLGGWHCRHSFYPYYEGDSRTYTQEMLDDYQAKKYRYNGQQLTEYEASQKQRYIERQIRRWKRENVTMNAAEQDTAESASKIAYWQGKQKDFIKQTGLKRQNDREQIAGYGKSHAQKALWKNRQTKANGIYRLANEKENMKAYLSDKAIHELLDKHGLNAILKINEREFIVEAGKPQIRGVRQHVLENIQNKPDRKEMTAEKAQSFIDNAKLAVYNTDKQTIKFLAQDGYAVLNFNRELVTAVPQKWRKKFDTYLKG